ncbi:transposase, partial [Corynebacterium belfantii]|uniref:transposase n=1 Tax=Corynebacterium belfantii TaxID=2014537 RepID=UPI001F2BE731
VDGHGPARLLDMRPGRSADVLSGWLKERDPSFREQIQVVTMDEFTGYTTAVEEQLPQANKVIDPFPCSGGLLRVWLTSSLFRWGGAGKDIDHVEVVFRAVQS